MRAPNELIQTPIDFLIEQSVFYKMPQSFHNICCIHKSMQIKTVKTWPYTTPFAIPRPSSCNIVQNGFLGRPCDFEFIIF